MVNIIYKLMRCLGFPFFFRFLFQRKKITVLMFHNPSFKAAEMAFAYLSKKYNIISFEMYRQAQIDGKVHELPSRSVVLTFDDGHIGNYSLLPLFKKYGIKPTIFLCVGMLNTNKHFWFNHVPLGVNRSGLKHLPYEMMLQQLGNYDINKEYDAPEVLSFEMLQEMDRYVDFQVHGMYHPCLPNCSCEIAKNEIQQAKIDLETILGRGVNAFCFPNGDYGMREIDLVKQAGYSYSFTVDPGYNGNNTDTYHIKRFSINDTADINELAMKASGAWFMLKKWII